MAILEDRQSDYINILYHMFKLFTSVVVVVAQRIRLASISVVRVARPTTSRYIWVESQGLIKFILKIHNIFSGNIPDTLGERILFVMLSFIMSHNFGYFIKFVPHRVRLFFSV